MAAFNGRWKKVSASNVDEIIKELGAPADKAEKLKALFGSLDEVEEYNNDAETTHRKQFIGGKLVKESKRRFNEDFEIETLLGPCVGHGKLISDTRIEVTESGASRSGLGVVRLDGGKLYNEYTVNGVTLTRVYERE